MTNLGSAEGFGRTIVTIGIDGEILVYVLTASLAVSAGLVFGGVSATARRRSTISAGLLIVGVVTAAGFALGSSAPWVGPIFAIVSMLAGTLFAAAAKRDEPAFEDESFGSRLVAVLNVRRGVPLEEAGLRPDGDG
jgi:hypothetical protein